MEAIGKMMALLVLVCFLHKSNGCTSLNSYSECVNAINVGNIVYNCGDNYLFQCTSNELASITIAITCTCSDNALFVSTADKIAHLCRYYSYSDDTKIDFNSTSQIVIKSYSSDKEAKHSVSLPNCSYGCSAKPTLKVNSISGCSIYVSTYSLYPYYKILSILDAKIGEEHAFSLNYNALDSTQNIYAFVFMLPTTIDSNVKMEANYTISLTGCGYSIGDPSAENGVIVRTGTSTKCSNNSQGDSHGMSTANKVLTVVVVLIAVWIFVATIMFIILIICILKIRNKRKGYCHNTSDSRISPDKAVLDENEDIDAKNPIKEIKTIPISKENGIYLDLKNI